MHAQGGTNLSAEYLRAALQAATRHRQASLVDGLCPTSGHPAAEGSFSAPRPHLCSEVACVASIITQIFMNYVCRQKMLPPSHHNSVHACTVLLPLCDMGCASPLLEMACLFCYLHSTIAAACVPAKHKRFVSWHVWAGRIPFIGGQPAKTSCQCFLQLFHLLCCTNVGTGAILLHRVPCSCIWLGWRQPVSSVGCSHLTCLCAATFFPAVSADEELL